MGNSIAIDPSIISSLYANIGNVGNTKLGASQAGTGSINPFVQTVEGLQGTGKVGGNTGINEVGAIGLAKAEDYQNGLGGYNGVQTKTEHGITTTLGKKCILIG